MGEVFISSDGKTVRLQPEDDTKAVQFDSSLIATPAPLPPTYLLPPNHALLAVFAGSGSREANSDDGSFEIDSGDDDANSSSALVKYGINEGIAAISYSLSLIFQTRVLVTVYSTDTFNTAKASFGLGSSFFTADKKGAGFSVRNSGGVPFLSAWLRDGPAHSIENAIVGVDPQVVHNYRIELPGSPSGSTKYFIDGVLVSTIASTYKPTGAEADMNYHFYVENILTLGETPGIKLDASFVSVKMAEK